MLSRILKPIALLAKTHKIIPFRHSFTFNTTKKATSSYKKSPQVREQTMGNIIVKNDNMRFDAEQYDMFMYPFHPQVTKKANNIYEINKNGHVLALNFVEKAPREYEQKMKQNWKNRKGIAFRFNELGKLLEVGTKEAGSWSIVVDRGYKEQKKTKTITFTNEKGSNFLKIILQDVSSEGQSKIQTKISHLQFSLFQFLLKESLADLSGMKLMFDIKRNEELAKIEEKGKNSDKESLFKDYDSKEDVV